MLADQDTFELWFTLWTVNIRCEGLLLEEKVALFVLSSPAMVMLMLSHWLWEEYTFNLAEVMIAPCGIEILLKRSAA